MSRIAQAPLPTDLPVQNNLIRALYNNPDMFRGFASLSGRVHSASHLPDRIREIVILRVCGLLNSEFQWQTHARIAERAGIGPRDLDDQFQGVSGRRRATNAPG